MTVPEPLARYWEDKKQPLIILAIGVAVIAAALLVTRTVGEDERPGWDAAPNETSCSEWSDRMTIDDRRTMASQMLHAVRAKDSLEAPSALLAEEFKTAIGVACVVPTASAGEIAVGVYMTERATFARP